MREQCPQLLNHFKSPGVLQASKVLCELPWLLEHGLSCIHKLPGATCNNIHVIEPGHLADPQPGTLQRTMGAIEGQIVSGAWHNAKVFAPLPAVCCATFALPCILCNGLLLLCPLASKPLWSLQTSDLAAAIWQKTSSTTCWLKTRGSPSSVSEASSKSSQGPPFQLDFLCLFSIGWQSPKIAWPKDVEQPTLTWQRDLAACLLLCWHWPLALEASQQHVHQTQSSYQLNQPWWCCEMQELSTPTHVLNPTATYPECFCMCGHLHVPKPQSHMANELQGHQCHCTLQCCPRQCHAFAVCP